MKNDVKRKRRKRKRKRRNAAKEKITRRVIYVRQTIRTIDKEPYKSYGILRLYFENLFDRWKRSGFYRNRIRKNLMAGMGKKNENKLENIEATMYCDELKSIVRAVTTLSLASS